MTKTCPLHQFYIKDVPSGIHHPLELTFNTGEVKRFDFTSLYNEGICKKLRDISYFKNFKLDGFTVDWNNEIGFAPEYLYEHGVAV